MVMSMQCLARKRLIVLFVSPPEMNYGMFVVLLVKEATQVLAESCQLCRLVLTPNLNQLGVAVRTRLVLQVSMKMPISEGQAQQSRSIPISQ